MAGVFYGSLVLKTLFFQYALGGQPGGDEHGGHTGAGVGAGADEIQVMVAAVAVVRTQVGHLGQLVAEPVRGTLRQVVAVLPPLGDKAKLFLYMRFDLRKAQLGPGAAE